MREKIEAKILFLTLGLMTLGTIIFGSYILYLDKTGLYEIAEDRSDTIASLIARNIERTMLEGRSDITKQMVDDLKAVKGVGGIEVLNAEGRAVFNKEAPVKEASAMQEINKTGMPLIIRSKDTLTFYKPLINTINCAKCHGAQDKIRGAVKVSLSIERVYERLFNTVMFALLAAIFGLLIVGSILLLVLRRIVVTPVKEIEKAALRMAEGDLSFPVEPRSKDEIGRLTSSLKESVRALANIIGRIKEVSKRVTNVTEGVGKESKRVVDGTQLEAEAIASISSSIEELNAAIGEVAESLESLSSSSEETAASVEQLVASISQIANNTIELSGVVDATSSSIEQMSATIKEVASGSGELSIVAEDTLTAVEEISTSIKEVENSAKEAAKLSEKVTSDASGFGMASIDSTIKGMEMIKAAVEKAAEFIRKLGGRSEEIGKILNVIDEVTDQTTLLALNAAILAAQAGEHGKGFSVVADEIKDLAERTSYSTQEIASLIQAVRTEVKGAVEAMGEGLRTVEDGFRLSREAGNALHKIVESSKTATQMAVAIERSTAEQAKGVKLVAEAAERLRNMVGQMTKATSEQTKGVGLIMNSVEKINDVTRQLSSATADQSKGSKQISEAIENISDRVSKISRAVQEQKIGSDQIITSLEKIRELPKKNRDLSFSINRSIRDLMKDMELLSTEVSRFKSVEESKDIIKMGIMPLESPAEMYRRFEPLAQYLTTRLGKKVDLKVSVDFDSTISDIGKGITRICYMTPSTYIEARDKYGIEVIAKALRDGKPYHHTVIVAKEGGKVSKIEDIKGKSFAFGDARSTSSHIVPRAMLLEAGIDLKGLSFYDYLGHHDDVARAILRGDFDAGGLMESTAVKFKDQGLKFIKFSFEIPEFNICVSKELSHEDREAVRDAIISLTDKTPEGTAVLKAISPEYTGFTGSADEDYDKIREVMLKLGLIQT